MTAPERRGPERPGSDYPAEWDREPIEPTYPPIGADAGKASSDRGAALDDEDDSLFETCEECEGWGGWTETHYNPAGRDLDADVICTNCAGSGRL